MSAIKDSVDVRKVSKRRVLKVLNNRAKESLESKEKTLLITNAVLSLDEILKLKELSGGLLRLVSVSEHDLSDSPVSLRNRADGLNALLELTKSSNRWFTYANKTMYLIKDNYVFTRNAYSVYALFEERRTELASQVYNSDNFINNEILLIKNKDMKATAYSSLVDLVETEYHEIEKYIASERRYLVDLIPNCVVSELGRRAMLRNGYSLSVEGDFLEITNIESPYKFYASIKHTSRYPEMYITDKDYIGHVSNLVDINPSLTDKNLTYKQAIDYLLSGVLMNEVLWPLAGVKDILIEDGKDTYVNDDNFIENATLILSEIMADTKQGEELPKFILSDDMCPTPAVKGVDGIYTYLSESAIKTN